MADDDLGPGDDTKERRKARAREPEPAPEPPPPGDGRASRLSRLGRRLLDRGDDVKELASAVLETSDRAKTEMVKMVAREVRNYLDEMKLKEDLLSLVRSHSLELNISIHLKPLAPDEEAPAPVAPRPPVEPSDD